MAVTVEPANLRHGRVRGRYFRENFAQAGIDLTQVIPELVTNADAAIAASGREHGRIQIGIGPSDPDFVRAWRAAVRRLRLPADASWKHEVVCVDDGQGVDAAVVDARLGALGVEPEWDGQRSLFGRGLRDVWMAQGGGRIQGVHGERAVESWFLPAAGDEPYAYVHVLDEPASPSIRRVFQIPGDGTRVTVPLLLRRLPPNARLRRLLSDLVQLRPILEDESRELLLELPGEALQLVRFTPPEPDPERPLLLDDELEIMRGVRARVVVRRSAHPIPLSPSRATRRGGLVIRSGRAAHESTLVGFESRPGGRHLYGEVWCDAIEILQREALDSPRPQVVVRVDRSGLNEAHPLVQRLYSALERTLRPLVEAEERRAGARLMRAGKETTARDEVGLRTLNDALRSAFDAPGRAGFARGGQPSQLAPLVPGQPDGQAQTPGAAVAATTPLEAAMRFKQSPIRIHPAEQRTVSLLFDPARIPAGTAIEIATDPGLSLSLASREVPQPGVRGWSRVSGSLRALASATPGAQLSVYAQAGDYDAELQVIVVRHRAHGWVREIARKDEDSHVEAEFDPETGVVTVYEGRREFKALERAARQGGRPRSRAREYVPYRMLEVEVAANAVYWWAAEQILSRRLPGERPGDPVEYAGAVRLEAQVLRHRFHDKLMKAFLGPEVFEGTVVLGSPAPTASKQLRLIPSE
jgi:hypothetical protein